MALNATFREVLEPFGVSLGLFTIIVGHATFCIVVVYNNVIARLRRVGGSLEEASADLGADTWQTFRLVTLPTLRSAMLAGALLAFALSFDEIIVTTFTAGAEQTLPIWIYSNIQRPNQLPIVNVVAVFVILFSMIPVYFAQRLTRERDDEPGGRGRPGGRRALGTLGATSALVPRWRAYMSSTYLNAGRSVSGSRQRFRSSGSRRGIDLVVGELGRAHER